MRTMLPFAAILLILVSLLPLVAFFAVVDRTGTASTHAESMPQHVESTPWYTDFIAIVRRPAFIATLRFTLGQALLSTAAALIIGMPGAWLAGRYQFKGRRFLLALSAVPFCMPPLLVILSFVGYYGKIGLLSRLAALAGIDYGNTGAFLYGFSGLILVHAFYNFPIVVQTVGSFWALVPPAGTEAARTLGAGRFRAFLTGSLPSLMPAIVQSASLIFLFCFFSFTVVLVFGGLAGSTLEVELYRALRFTGDGKTALALGAVQTGIALVCTGIFTLFDGRARAVTRNLGRAGARQKPKGAVIVLLALYFVFIGLFFIGPLVSLALQAFSIRQGLGPQSSFGLDNFASLLSSQHGRGSPLLQAIAGTLVTALPAALIATVLGLLAAATLHAAPQRQWQSASKTSGKFALRALDMSLLLPLAVSSAITTIGWGYLFPNGAIAVIAFGQAASIWPFAARQITGALAALSDDKRQAARSLGASPIRAFMDIDLPIIAPSIASAAAFSFSMAAGDANVPLVLGRGNIDTLPLLMYRLASSYRFQEASAAGLVLALVAGMAFYLKEKNTYAA